MTIGLTIRTRGFVPAFVFWFTKWEANVVIVIGKYLVHMSHSGYIAVELYLEYVVIKVKSKHNMLIRQPATHFTELIDVSNAYGSPDWYRH